MYRGTTPTHTFTLPDSYIGIDFDVVYITYAQHGKTVLEKTKEDVTIADGKITVVLQQEDTLKFCSNYTVYIQIRARTSNGMAVASKPIKISTEAILKDGVI